MTLNPFHGAGLLQGPLNTLGNLRFSDVFPKVEQEASAMKWAKDIFNK